MAEAPQIAAWANRIVGHGDADPRTLTANARNWRKHPKRQQEALGAMLDQVGWVQDVIVNQRTGNIVDGHLRVSLALSRNEAAVPVVYVDLSEEDEMLVLASLDPLAGMAVTDRDMLTALISDLDTEGALADMLDELIADRMTSDQRQAEWQGMPEFSQPNAQAWKTLPVHFATPEDLEAFGKLVGQPTSAGMRFMWFPAAEVQSRQTMRYSGESEE